MRFRKTLAAVTVSVAALVPVVALNIGSAHASIDYPSLFKKLCLVKVQTWLPATDAAKNPYGVPGVTCATAPGSTASVTYVGNTDKFGITVNNQTALAVKLHGDLVIVHYGAGKPTIQVVKSQVLPVKPKESKPLYAISGGKLVSIFVVHSIEVFPASAKAATPVTEPTGKPGVPSSNPVIQNI